MSEPTHTPLPESSSVSQRADATTSRNSEDDAGVDLSRIPDEHQKAVRRLQRQVEQATETIERLRAENEQLRKRVRELETRPAVSEDQTFLTFDEDPEELREQITEFIEAIDSYLDEGESSSPSEVESEEVSAETVTD